MSDTPARYAPAWVVHRREVIDYRQDPDGVWRPIGPPVPVASVDPQIVTPDLAALIETLTKDVPHGT